MKAKKSKRGRKNRNKARHRSPKLWMAIGTASALAVCTGLGCAPDVYAQGFHCSLPALYRQDQAGTPARRFDIPPGTLDVVLSTFQSVTGWRVVVTKNEIGDIASPGVSGVRTAEQALKQLLAGTGVIYRFIASETVTLEVSGPTSSVNVTAPVAVASSPKYTEPLRDIPQTITVIPKAVIEEQGATTLRDVLRNVPGLTITAGEGGAPAGDNLTLRGFSARNDIFVDGVRDLGPQSRDPFNLEQVEVVKGPSSAYNGRGSTGGTINMVSKSPLLDTAYGFTFNLGTDETRRVTGDMNLPLERLGLGKRTAFRLNLLAHESGVAGRDVVKNQRWGVAPSLALGLGTPSRLAFSYFKLKQDNISDYGIPWVPATNNVLREYRDRPAPVPRNTFYGLKNRDSEKLNSDLATIRFERDFSDAVTLRNQLRYGRSTRDSIATPPRFASNDSTVINREMRSWLTEDGIWDDQTDLRARFSTGKIEHTLIGGLALTRETNERRTRTAPNMPTTLLNPNPDDAYTGTITLSPIVGDVTGNSIAAYAFDTVRINPKIEFNGGLRWDYFDVDGITTTGAPIARIDRMLSWRVGAVYKPKPSGSIYASYGTSLNPSLEGLSYQTASAAIEPEKTYTFEIGSKWDIFKQRLSLNGALFRVEKTNARTPGITPDEPPQVLEGRQRVDGVEISASGQITRQWKLFSAYTYLDSEIVDSNNPAEIGKELQNTPRNSFNVWTTYDSPWRVGFGGGARYVARRFGNNTNTRFVDSYWTIDGLVSYPLAESVSLRLNLYNLTDEYYFDRLGSGHLVPGPGRAVSLNLGFRF